MTTYELIAKTAETKYALASAGTEQKNRALLAMADAIEAATEEILACNREDIEASRSKYSDVMIDRLMLDPDRIHGMADGIRQVVDLPDPAGQILRTVTRPNGLVIQKVSAPMGVIAIIYESRPNVTSDAAALSLKAGSACVLRSGKEAWKTSNAIVEAMKQGLKEAGLPEDSINLIQDTSRESGKVLMTAEGLVDLLIPRGGKGLKKAIAEQATVPTIQTGDGVCHVYVDATADQEMALNIIENAKTSRPSVCNAEEVLLVHEAAAEAFLPRLKEKLVDERAVNGLPLVELRLDEEAAALIARHKERKATGLFTAEGKKIFLEAPRSLVVKVIVSESFEKNNAAFIGTMAACAWLFSFCSIFQYRLLNNLYFSCSNVRAMAHITFFASSLL